MDFTVELTIHTKHPLTEEVLGNVADVGGVAVGDVGDHRLETTLTISAKDLLQAGARGAARILKIAPGALIAVEAMTTAEQDRRLEEPDPEYIGIAELAEMLGVSRQRASVLSQRNDFPRPVAKLAAGPVWIKSETVTFAQGWHRKPGRKPQDGSEAPASAA